MLSDLNGISHVSIQTLQNLANTLQHDVSVVLKLIQVYVMDKDGKPVMDLARDDFILVDNGKPVVITEFEKHNLAAMPADTAPAAEASPTPVLARPPTLSRKFVILIDFAFNTARGAGASFEAVRHFLDQEVRPEDELSLMSYSMLRGLKIHEFLTKDHDKVKTALAAITSKDIAGRADEIEQAYWMMADTLGEAKYMSRDEAAQFKSMDMQRRDSMQQAKNYFADLTRLAQALRLVPGQKNVLFFSLGVPSSLINMSRQVGTDQNINDTGSASFKSTGTIWQIGDSVLSSLQEKMLKEFTASNCSIFAFDTRESSKLPALFTYDEMAFLSRPTGGLLGADSGGVFRDDKTTGMDSLRRISKQTGGKYYSNISFHEKNLEEVSAITGTYYVLGYPVTAVADGRFHNVKIEVKRKSCQVQTQPGYFNPKPFHEYTDIEKNIHLFALALNEGSEFQASKSLPISALSYNSGQGSRVRELVRISDEIWKRFTGQTAEIVALFFDAQDALMSLQRVIVPLAEYRGKEVLFSAAVSARPGPTKCRVVIRDLSTGEGAVGTTTAYSVPPSRQDLAIFSPLVIVEGGYAFYLEAVIKGTSESPPWREIYPFDGASYSPIIGGDAICVAKAYLIMPCSASGYSALDLAFKANLVNSDTGESLAMPLERQESLTYNDVIVQKFAIPLESVPNGSFLLYIHVSNKITGRVSSVHVPMLVGRRSAR